MKKKFGRKFLSVLIVVVMLCTSLLSGTVQAADSGSTTIFDKNGLKVDCKIDSQWVGFFNGTMTVTNTGTQPVEDWAITFDFPHEITNIWNAAVIEHQPGVYTVKNLGWNQDIPVGGSINFGFTAAASGEITRPTFFAVNTKTTEVAADLIKTEYVLYSDWGSGYSAALTITNLSQTKIEDWTIDFDFARSINNLYSGKLLAHNGTHYTVQNDGYTQNLSAGQTIQLGLGGTGGAAADVPTGIVVTQIVPAFDLVSDTDGDLILDWVEICVNGTDPLVPEGVVTTPTPTPIEVTPTPIEVSPTPVEPTPTSVEPTPTTIEPTPTSIPDLETDTDGDLIPDYYEAMIGTDPILADTDGDGLGDYEEVFILGFDPLSADGDADGISDYDEDVDQDGLSFRQERQAGTDSYNSDTDADGLLDGEEVNTYGTNPIAADTDDDGLCDGDEVALGLNPLVADTDGDGVLDSQEKILQTVTEEITETSKPEVTEVSVSMNAAGNMQNNTQIENVYNIDVQTSDVVGLIGAPVEITSDAAFDEATITFLYDDTLLGDTPEENLAIMWYDKANDEYIVLDDEDVLDTVNNTIRYTTTHFSTYMVVDKAVWFEVWRQNLDTVSEARDLYYSAIPVPNFDFVFAVPGTSSMFPTMVTQAIQIQTGFIEAMQEGDRGALLVFGESGWGSYFFLTNKEEMKTRIPILYSDTATTTEWIIQNPDVNFFTNLNSAYKLSNFIYSKNKYPPFNEKILIIISNGINVIHGSDEYDALYPDLYPTVYTIRIGSSSSSDGVLQSFAEDNGGELIIADTSQNIMEAISNDQSENKKVEIDITDADNDGLADIFETTGILLSNGRIIYTDPTNSDTDYDGLLDGQEIGAPVAISSLTQGERIIFYQGAGYTNMYNYCFKYSSNPTMKDTDGDRYSDDIDPRPLWDDIETIDLKNQSLGKQGYLQIQDFDNSTVSYGGSQMWFDETDYWGNMQDYMIHYFGCGLIAFTDLLVYQEGYRSLYKSVEMDYIRTANDNLPIIGTGIEQENNHYGIGPNGLSIATAINLYYFVCGDSDKASWEWSLDDKEMLEDIRKMLDEDIPVIMSLGPNFPDVINGSSGIAFYKLNVPGDKDYINTNSIDIYQFLPSTEDNVNGHYFTVTGIFEDNISGKTMLRISSWGFEYYIDYAAYRNYADNTSNRATTSIINITT